MLQLSATPDSRMSRSCRAVDPDVARWRRLIELPTPVNAPRECVSAPYAPRRQKTIPNYPMCPPVGHSQYAQRRIAHYRPGCVSTIDLASFPLADSANVEESTRIALDDCIKTQRRLLRCARGFERRFVETAQQVRDLEEQKLRQAQNRRNGAFVRRIAALHAEVDWLMR